MGLAASQARLLMLYSRKSDLEYQVQTINNRRLMIASQTDQISQTYSNALAERILKVMLNGQEYSLNTGNLSLVNLQATYVASGQSVPTSITSTALEEGIRDGAIQLSYITAPTGVTTSTVDWSTCSNIEDRLYTEIEPEAEATYTYQTSVLQGQDKELEMEEKNYETQQSAISTEIDAVKKVIDKNIEKSFKTLG